MSKGAGKPGWEIKKLGDVCSFENGDRGTNYPSRSARTSQGIPFINAGHLTDDGIDIGRMNYISRERFDLLSNGKIRSGDILFCLRGSLGKCASVGDLCEGAIASSLVIVRPRESVLDAYVMDYFRSDICSRMIAQFKNGAAQPNLSANSLGSFTIPVPPLPEQKRIVGILDEAFDGIATAKANAEKNLQNARALFESHLHAVFSQRCERSAERPLGEICRFSSGGTPSKTESRYWNGSTPWISGRDMKSTRLSDAALHISQEALAESSTRMAPAGALLTLVRGMGLAHGAQIAELMVPCAFNQDIRAIHPERNIASRFLLFALRTGINHSENVLSNAAHGTLKIDMDALSSVAIPVPSRVEQERVVRQIDALDAETSRIESLYRQKLAALDALKKSLLDRAFSGLL